MRILGLLNADKDSEAGAPPSQDLVEKMGTFIEEVTKAGVLLATDGLHPSSKGTRVKLSEGKVTVTDGPFAETKELVASYALFQVNTMAEAVEWTTRFLKVLGEGECELRPIFEASDFAPWRSFLPRRPRAKRRIAGRCRRMPKSSSRLTAPRHAVRGALEFGHPVRGAMFIEA